MFAMTITLNFKPSEDLTFVKIMYIYVCTFLYINQVLPHKKKYFAFILSKLRLKCDGARAETRFRLSAKRTSLNRWGRQFSRLLAGELYTSACRVCTARASLCSAVI